jgi:PAS domain S-box-containing protein
VAGREVLAAAVGELERSSGPSRARVRVLTLAGGAAGAVVALLGLLVMAGWLFDVPRLTRVGPNLVTMKFGTASSLALIGTAIGLSSLARVSGNHRWQVAGLALLVPVVLLAGLTLVEEVLGLTSSLDNLFGLDPGDPYTPVPGRMAQMTAASLLALSAALVLLARAAVRVAQVLAVTTIAAGLTAVVGYAFGVRSLYGVGPLHTMALHTAVAILVAGLGVLFLRPGEGYLSLLVGNTAGGVIVRRVLPWVLLLPIVAGATVVAGLRQGAYSGPFAVALFATVIAYAGAALVWFQGERLRDVDLRRGGAEHALRIAEEAIAARERIAEELAASERRTRRILATAADAYVAIDTGGRVTDWNDAASAMFGWTRTEAVGRPLGDLVIPPGQGSLHEAAIRRSSEPSEMPVLGRLRELEAVTRGGARIPVEVRVWTDHDGPDTSFHAFIRDITERKQAEEGLRALNADLAEFAAIAAHDLRAPLATIRMQVDLVLTELAARARGEQSEADVGEWIARIGQTAERGTTLIDELLDYASIGREAPPAQAVALAPLAEEVADEQVTDCGRVVALTVDPLPVVAGDRALLRQLLANLIGNAIKYAPTDRVPTVRVDAVDAPGGRCVLRVTDNGTGFAPDEVEHVFDMFRRGRGAADIPGTGIGLAICRRVAERHGGRIWIETPPEGGSRVCVDLPLRRG